MPLYDAFNRPIPEPPNHSKPESTELSPKRAQQEQEPSVPPRRGRGSRLKLILEVLTLSGLFLGLFWGFLQFRQEIAVDPSVSYDASDPFNQRFVISNNGPFQVEDVHYACAITHIETDDGLFDKLVTTSPWIMVPTTPHIQEFPWKQKASTQCDFAARFGAGLRAVRIEIKVFYKGQWWRAQQKSKWTFSGKRGDSGKFLWDYGSPDERVFDAHDARPLFLIPFNSTCEVFAPAALLADIKELIALGHKNGHKVIVGTLTACSPPAPAR